MSTDDENRDVETALIAAGLVVLMAVYYGDQWARTGESYFLFVAVGAAVIAVGVGFGVIAWRVIRGRMG